MSHARSLETQQDTGPIIVTSGLYTYNIAADGTTSVHEADTPVLVTVTDTKIDMKPLDHIEAEDPFFMWMVRRAWLYLQATPDGQHGITHHANRLKLDRNIIHLQMAVTTARTSIGYLEEGGQTERNELMNVHNQWQKLHA